MASVVSIKVVIDGTEDSVQRIDKLDAAMKDLGLNGTVSIRRLGEGLDQVGGHAQTNLDKVRLLSQEFGLRLPRALESTLSRMPQFMSALTGIGGAITGFAFAEVFVRMGEAIYNAEQKYISITSAAKKFNEELEKTTHLDFTNTKDIETTAERLANAQERAKNGPVVAQQLQNNAWWETIRSSFGGGIGSGMLNMGGVDTLAAHDAAANAAEGNQQALELQKKQIDTDHDAAIAKINLAHAMDAELDRRAQILASRDKTKALDAEEAAYNSKLEGFYGNPVATDAGLSEQRMKDAQADAEAQAKLNSLSLEQYAAITKARGEAAEAGLQGEALYSQKLKDTLADLHAELAAQRDLGEYSARAAAVQAQFDADRAARLRTLTEETQHLKDETASAGLTGAARIVADRNAQISSINDKEQKFSGGAPLSPEASADFDQQRAAATSAANAKILALEQEFTTRAEALAQERADAELGAFGKIDAAAARSVAELKKTYDQDFSALAADDQRKIDATKSYNDAVAAINANAAQQKAELAARNRAEDAQYDREAAQAESHVRSDGMTSWVGQHQQAVLAIEDQEAQRIAKLQEDAAKEGLTWQEVAQRRADIERQAVAEIQETDEQMAHQIAGTLQSAFTDPMRFIKEQGEKMMFEMIARWLMQLGLFKNSYAAIMGGLQPGAPGASGSAGGFGGAAARMIFGGGGSTAGYSIGAIANGDFSGGTGYRPSGTAGIVSGGSSVTSTTSSASPSYSPAGTASAGPQLLRRDSTISPLAMASSSLSDTRQLASMFGLTGTQAQAAGLPIAMGTAASDASALGAAAASGPGAAGAGGGFGAAAAGALPGTTSLAGVMSLAGAGLAGYQGAEGVLTGFHTGGVNGVLDSTMSGAALGAAAGSIIPGLGTVVGGAIGAAAGLVTNVVGDALGESGKFGARAYYEKTVFPQLEGVLSRYSSGGGDYLSAIDEANKDAYEATQYMTQHWQSESAQWVKANYMDKELAKVTTSIERMGKLGAFTGRTAAEFHDGGLISGFGDLGTTSTEGYIHAMLGEGIVNRPAMATHGAGVGLMNNGASPADMASHYLSMMPGGGSVGAGGGDTHHHWDVSALDAASFSKMLDSGGAAVINRSLNRFTSRYAGDGQP